MAPVNPCCCCDIKIGVIVMTSIFLFFDVIEIPRTMAILITSDYSYTDANNEVLQRLSGDEEFAIAMVYLGANFVEIVVTIITLIGACNRIVGMIRSWYAIVLVYLFYAGASFRKFKMDYIYFWVIAVVFVGLFIAYFVWVAQALINKIKAEDRGEIPAEGQAFNQFQPTHYAYPQQNAGYPVQGQPPPPYYSPQGQQSPPAYYQQQQGQQPPGYFQQQGQQPPGYFQQQGQQPPGYFQQQGQQLPAFAGNEKGNAGP